MWIICTGDKDNAKQLTTLQFKTFQQAETYLKRTYSELQQISTAAFRTKEGVSLFITLHTDS